MARRPTMVQLTEDLLARLDRRAIREGASRSHVIRCAVETYLAGDGAAEVDRQIVRGYTDAPQGGALDRDAWGDLAGMNDAMTAASLRQVAEEERAAGHAPW